MDVGLLHRVLLVATLAAASVIVHSASVWFEDPPSLDDPCTIVVVQGARGEIDDVHPSIECRERAGLVWYATFGRIHLHLFYDTEPEDSKRRDFELCLTSGLPERIYVWWDSKNDSWSAISPPVWHAQTYKSDWCRRSQNGTMDLYLEPPWAFINYVTHISWRVTFIDDLPLDEQIIRPKLDEVEDSVGGEESLGGAAT